MNKYIDADKLKAEIERRKDEWQALINKNNAVNLTAVKEVIYEDLNILDIINSLQQEQPQEENKLPNKRTRVNYAICKLQTFKPLREAIVLDDYVYDEGKCYRENLINYIHAIPENRLTEIRSYLKENGRWPYDDDDDDWITQEHISDLQDNLHSKGYIFIVGGIEYIRKDILLKWAKEKNQGIDTDEGDYSLGYVSAMIDLIDKLNSM